MRDADMDYFSRFELGAGTESDWEDSYEDDFDYAKDEDPFTFDDEYVVDMEDDEPIDDLRLED